MQYFKKINNNKIECLLCQNYCKLENDKIGICGVNKNNSGKLENLVYGYPVSLNIDPIEKKPLYHFLPNSTTLSYGTIGCNFKCPFCQNWEISQTKNIDKSVVVTPQQIVDLALEYGAKSISHTYNEPTIYYPYAKEIGILAKENGLKNIFVSNGFQSKEMIEDMKTWVDAINIDLKSFNNNYYKKDLKGNLDTILENLKLFYKNKIWIEITTLLIEDINTNKNEIKNIIQFIVKELDNSIPWHISAFTPNYKMKEHKPTKLKTITDIYDLGIKLGLKNIYFGNIPVPNETICPNCNELLILREGFKIIKNLIIDEKCFKCKQNINGIW